jgi:hypothetical protein
MGTFHAGRGELHGITVVVEARDGRVWIGRCDTVDAAGVHLLDADLHEERPGAPTRAEYLEQARRWGIWKRYDRVDVPSADVLSVRRLGDDAPA